MIRIICIGKLKEKYLVNMIEDYLKRNNVDNKDCSIIINKLIIKRDLNFSSLFFLYVFTSKTKLNNSIFYTK